MNDGYVISFDRRGPVTIQHLRCGMTSWNKNDIEHRYCGACHVFMDLFAFDDNQAMKQYVDLAREAIRWPKDGD